MLLLFKERVVMFNKFPISVGSVPRNWLYSTVVPAIRKAQEILDQIYKGDNLGEQSNYRFKSKTSPSNVDNSDLLKSSARISIIVPTSVGMEPVKLLSFNLSCSSLDSFPS